MTTVDPEVIQAPSVSVSDGHGDGVTLLFTSSVQTWGRLLYGTATGVYTNVILPEVFGQPSVNSPGNFAYLWIITDKMRQAVDTTYYAIVVFRDGTQSSEATWTQPGLGAQATDVVTFAQRNLTRLAKLSELANKAATQGWLSTDEYFSFQLLAASTAWFNSIQWADGR